MQVRCPKCRRQYDDAERFTYCPHPMLMSRDMLEQKQRGLDLIGKTVSFRHRPEEQYRVTGVGYDGMVALDSFSGYFAPHLFYVVRTETPNQAKRAAETQTPEVTERAKRVSSPTEE